MMSYRVAYWLITLAWSVVVYVTFTTLIDGYSPYLIAAVMMAFLMFVMFARRPIAERLSGRARGNGVRDVGTPD